MVVTPSQAQVDEQVAEVTLFSATEFASNQSTKEWFSANHHKEDLRDYLQVNEQLYMPEMVLSRHSFG
jgi:hypothetical protein